MDTLYSWLKRITVGGCCAVLAAAFLALLLNLTLNSAVWLGGSPDLSRFQLTFDRCSAYFGSTALAVTVELLAVFALGAAVGVATMPFADTPAELLRLSLLHFLITGMLALIAGWSYRWFGMEPGCGAAAVLGVYTVIYAAVWGLRWVFWYAELCQMRRALKLLKGK